MSEENKHIQTEDETDAVGGIAAPNPTTLLDRFKDFMVDLLGSKNRKDISQNYDSTPTKLHDNTPAPGDNEDFIVPSDPIKQTTDNLRPDNVGREVK